MQLKLVQLNRKSAQLKDKRYALHVTYDLTFEAPV